MEYTNLLSDGYQHRKHNKNLFMVHIVLVTKYRKKLLSGVFDTDLKQTVYDSCVKHHWYIRTMETDKDHIHILLQYNPSDSVSEIVGTIKQESAYSMWNRHQNYLSKCYWKEKTLWSDRYFACSIGNASKEVIEKYIENQG